MKQKLIASAILILFTPFLINIIAYLRYFFASPERRRSMRDHKEV